MVDTNDLTPVPAVVLAGGLNDAAMRAATGVENRALVELSPGKSMLDFVVSAIRGAITVGEIAIVGNVPDSTDYRRIPPAATFLENLMKGVNAVTAGTDNILIVTSDIPFISSAAIDDFVSEAHASRGAFCYPIIPMDICRRQFSGLKRTTLRLAEGEFTGGNVMLVKASYLHDHDQTIMAAYAARKNVLRLGSMLGWGLLARLILSQTVFPKILTVNDLESGVSRLLGHGNVAKAIITQHASLGTDIDKPEDVAEARRLLALPTAVVTPERP